MTELRSSPLPACLSTPRYDRPPELTLRGPPDPCTDRAVRRSIFHRIRLPPSSCDPLTHQRRFLAELVATAVGPVKFSLPATCAQVSGAALSILRRRSAIDSARFDRSYGISREAQNDSVFLQVCSFGTAMTERIRCVTDFGLSCCDRKVATSATRSQCFFTPHFLRKRFVEKPGTAVSPMLRSPRALRTVSLRLCSPIQRFLSAARMSDHG